MSPAKARACQGHLRFNNSGFVRNFPHCRSLRRPVRHRRKHGRWAVLHRCGSRPFGRGHPRFATCSMFSSLAIETFPEKKRGNSERCKHLQLHAPVHGW